MIDISQLRSYNFAGCIVIVAMTYDVLGGDATPTAATGPWCWIAENAKNGTMWRFVTGKGWEISCYLITTSLYVLLKFHIVSTTLISDITPSVLSRHRLLVCECGDLILIKDGKLQLPCTYW